MQLWDFLPQEPVYLASLGWGFGILPQAAKYLGLDPICSPFPMCLEINL